LGFMIGGGLDFKLSKHVALRLPRVDYVMSSYRYGPSSNTGSTDLRGIRAQAGLVFTRGGEHTVAQPRAVCSIQPGEVFAGEPVSVTVEGSNFHPKRTVSYSWSGSGVRTGETGASTQLDTGSLRSGSYEVTASVNDGSPDGFLHREIHGERGAPACHFLFVRPSQCGHGRKVDHHFGGQQSRWPQADL